MKDLKAIKKDLMEIQKNFNPEKSTYKVFDELIKNNYTTEEIISVLSKIRGIHKYPDRLKGEFLGIINNLNILKEQELREKLLAKKEIEKEKQEANTRELKDIIDNLEQKMQAEKTKETSANKKNLEEVEVLEPVSLKKEEINENQEDVKPIKSIPVSTDEDGKILSIILGLLIIICIIVAVLLLLIY